MNIVRAATAYINHLTFCLQTHDAKLRYIRKQYELSPWLPQPYTFQDLQPTTPTTKPTYDMGYGMLCSWCSSYYYSSPYYVQAVTPTPLISSSWALLASPVVAACDSNPFTCIKETSQKHSVYQARNTARIPYTYQQSSIAMSKYEQTTVTQADDVISPGQSHSRSVLSSELRAQFRNEYPALSSMLDLEEMTSARQRGSQSRDPSLADSRSHSSESTDTDLDLSCNADDDNVFLDNCANPDDVTIDQISMATKPDSTTEKKVSGKGKDTSKKGEVNISYTPNTQENVQHV